jgi:hypothetical protein
MYIYIYIYVYMYIYIYIYIDIHIYIYTYMYIHIYVCIHIHIYRYIHVHIYASIYSNRLIPRSAPVPVGPVRAIPRLPDGPPSYRTEKKKRCTERLKISWQCQRGRGDWKCRYVSIHIYMYMISYMHIFEYIHQFMNVLISFIHLHSCFYIHLYFHNDHSYVWCMYMNRE